MLTLSATHRTSPYFSEKINNSLRIAELIHFFWNITDNISCCQGSLLNSIALTLASKVMSINESTMKDFLFHGYELY